MNRSALIAAMLVAPLAALAQPSFRGLGVFQGLDTTAAYAVSEDGLFVTGYGERAMPFLAWYPASEPLSPTKTEPSAETPVAVL